MNEALPFDNYSLITLFVLSLALQILFIEIGFWIGKRLSGSKVKAQVSQVRSLMGAGLGLLAFMMAFTFSTGQTHYEARVLTMVEEARLVRTAYLQAEILPKPYAEPAQKLLREYVSDRLAIDSLLLEKSSDSNTKEIYSLIAKSEVIQKQLWKLAIELDKAQSSGGSEFEYAEAFKASVIGIIDMHAARLEASLMNRIPFMIWITLYLMAALSMMVMGYQASLVGRRSPMATFTLAIAFSAVMMLITDLDRPRMSLFHINDHVLVKLQEQMKEVD